MKNYLGPLKEALDWCVEDKVIPSNPIAKMTAPKWQKPIPDPFSLSDSDQIIDSMASRHPGQVHNLTEFWFWTGMRTSEVFGLKWDSVDFVHKTAKIHEVLVRGDEKDSTKTDTIREVRLNSRAMGALMRQKKHTFLAGKEIFHDPRYDTRWNDERAFRRSFWAPTIKLLGLRYRRPYNMRHSYAQRMLEENMNSAFCAEQLGHSHEMFLNTYTTKIGEDRKALEMAKLESAMKLPKKEVVKEKDAA